MASLLTALALVGCGIASAPPTNPSTPTRTVVAHVTAPIVAMPTALPSATSMPALVTPVPSPMPDKEVLAVELRREIFESVWTTIRDEYVYADYGGVDWNAVRDVYEPRVLAVDSREKFYALMAGLVTRLDDNHSRFVPPSDVQKEDLSSAGNVVQVGIGIVAQHRPDGAFIQLVLPESPAERAGLQPRDRIITVNGRPYLPADGDLAGDVDTTVRLTVKRPGQKSWDVVLARQGVREHVAPYYRRFPGEIGYVAIPTLWVSDMGEQVSGALTDLVAAGPLHGLVIDVRANRGGWGAVLSDVLSHFVRGQVGTFVKRRDARPFVVPPPSGPDLRSLPLVVLIDHETASYAEVLAAVLQREANAQVVGVRSAGNTETIYAHSLPDGSRLWLAQEIFQLRDGTSLERLGVTPDSIVDIDWTHFSEDDDPQLLEALHLLGGGPK